MTLSLEDEEPFLEWGWGRGRGCPLGRRSYVAERGVMLRWNTGVRKGNVSLGNTVDKHPMGTRKKISKQSLET